MPAAERVLLVFGSRQVAVDASLACRRAGLRAFEREAEAAWGLHPKSYALFGACGKVETPEALQRTLEAAADGDCALEVREHPEWKAMRAAVQTIEERVMAKVDQALAGLREEIRHTDANLCNGIAPVVQNIAMEQIDLRGKLATLTAIAPMVQCLALDQMDVKAKLTDLEAKKPAPAAAVREIAAPQLVVYPVLTPASMTSEASRAVSSNAQSAVEDKGSDALKELEDIERQLRQDFEGRFKAVEQADEFLYSELQAVRDDVQGARDGLKDLRADVCGLEQKQATAMEIDGHASATPPEDRQRAAQAAKQAGGGPDDWMGWPESSLASLPFSAKLVLDQPQKASGGKKLRHGGSRRGNMEAMPEAAALFARGPSMRSLERGPCTMSAPLLPPLRC
mmetsp:Transcript_48791/g.139583  ORF Transcript_48791/g.139583 Transcript_48791/m.139583 type:complete len:396 (+) Transcript_48791:65-1252(+)